MLVLILGLLAAASAGTSSDDKETFKNQFRSTSHNAGKHKGKHESFSTEYCTDPRTMKKHAAYTEWADAYSCTRHRCQPGGRNLAIYTVGCKRVEAPESAIECEEVVEDTNMQFPFCCTRLRCLVVVRGEVWTRVLGQPWEVLPAAPWSHMYKMKKPPPNDSFLPKTADQGPVYELADSDAEQGGRDKMLRSGKKANSDFSSDMGHAVARASMPAPDIVIALSTNEAKQNSYNKWHGNTRRAKHEKASPQPPNNYYEEDSEPGKRAEPKIQDVEEAPPSSEKPPEPAEEIENANIKYVETEKAPYNSRNTNNPVSWTEIPQNQWNEPKETAETENRIDEHSNNYPQEPQPNLEMAEPKETLQIPLKKDAADRPSNLQALVDAIGSRMRDIESVVQKMSDKVHQAKAPVEGSSEKRMSAEQGKRRKESKRQSAEDENYRRFSSHNDRGSKYLHSIPDSTTDKPLYIEETNPTGYFSDASNSVLRRNNPPKEPPPTYMAPVDTRRKGPVHIAVPNTVEDVDKKHKKRTHKKRKTKGSRSHRKHSRSKDEKRKHFNHLSSGESEKNAVSLDDSSAGAQ